MKYRLLGLALLATIPFASGCKSKSRGTTVAVDTHTEFFWDASVVAYTEVEEYEWYNPHIDATIDFDAIDFFGSFTVEVYDEFDDLVHFRTYIGVGFDEIWKDKTDYGEPGYWWIVIRSLDVQGDLQLTIDGVY